MKKLSPLLVLPLFLVLGGCLPKLSSEASGGQQFRPSPVSETALFGGEPPRWGLALSGGGLRSALFSAGVMKAMYDVGALDSIQIVSTVSGGGYNAYWVYSRQLTAGGSQFGDATFSDGEFKLGLCEVALAGNFVPLPSIVGAAFTSLFGRGFRTLYEGRLERTFGQADTLGLQIHQLLPHTRGASRSGGVLPYLVMNTTVLEPKPTSGYADGLFEMTPLHHGNNARGYSPWGVRSIPMLKAVAISGAAQTPLKQRVRFESAPSVVLADGGGSENLATIALVRRRVRNIIIVDGGQDPNYSFVDYYDLKSRLAYWGYTFLVESIESNRGGTNDGDGHYHMPTAVHTGFVRSNAPGDEYIGRVLYVKLTVPRTLAPQFADEAAIARGDALWDTVFTTLKASPAPGTTNWTCESLAPISGSFDDFFTAVVYHYNNFNPARPPGAQYSMNGMWATNFPHLSTVLLQSMELDVSSSLVGLGYLIGKTELEPALQGLYGGGVAMDR